jgi:hypothetical protein
MLSELISSISLSFHIKSCPTFRAFYVHHAPLPQYHKPMKAPSSFACRFGGEEGLENFILDIRRDAKLSFMAISSCVSVSWVVMDTVG